MFILNGIVKYKSQPIDIILECMKTTFFSCTKTYFYLLRSASIHLVLYGILQCISWSYLRIPCGLTRITLVEINIRVHCDMEFEKRSTSELFIPCEMLCRWNHFYRTSEMVFKLNKRKVLLVFSWASYLLGLSYISGYFFGFLKPYTMARRQFGFNR